MKITIVMGPFFPVPPIQGGSTHRFWYQLAESFHKSGHSVTVLSKRWFGQPKFEVVNGIQYIRSTNFYQSKFTLVNVAKDLIYSLSILSKIPSADVIVTNNFWMPILARKRFGEVVVSLGRQPKGQLILFPRRVNFFVPSASIKSAVEKEIPLRKDKIRLVPNPIGKEFLLNIKPVRKRNKNILYVGRINEEKGIHLLVKAFGMISKVFPDATLKIVGPTAIKQGGSGKKYLRLLKSLISENNVKIIDPVFDLDRLINIYREADVFCYPSLAESGEALPFAPLEAMACGLLTIVSSLDCFKDYIDNGKTGLVFNHRAFDPVGDLSKILSIALNESEDNYMIISNALSKVKEFSVANISGIYLKYFDELLHK